MCFFFSSRRRHTRYWRDWSSDVCSSDLKQNNGALGTFTKGVMVQEFYDAAIKLKVGEISEPVKSQFGFHIIKLSEIVEDYEKFSNESKESIKQKLRQSILSEKFKTELDR